MYHSFSNVKEQREYHHRIISSGGIGGRGAARKLSKLHTVVVVSV